MATAKKTAGTATKRPMPKGSGNKFDWPAIKRDYVEGFSLESGQRDWPAYSFLERKYGTGKGTVATKGATENWPKAREEYLAAIEQARRTAIAEALGKKALEVDNECVNLAEMGLGEVRRHFEVFHAYIKRLTASTEVESDALATLYPALDLDRLGRALERFQKVARLSMGEATERTEETIKEGKELISALQDYTKVYQEMTETVPIPLLPDEIEAEEHEAHVAH